MRFRFHGPFEPGFALFQRGVRGLSLYYLIRVVRYKEMEGT